MWGQEVGYLFDKGGNGIIPTRVGTRKVFCSDTSNCRDHPHACGDKVKIFKLSTGAMGSSPRVWGQGSFAVRFAVLIRIIPTRVGTRKHFINLIIKFRDHPHACGDKVDVHIGQMLSNGSSPRVWGQGIRKKAAQILDRIIPTRVGTSSALTLSVLYLKDHPHACGDKKVKEENKWLTTGSSPRVWGQERKYTMTSCVKGIIPTRVGTSGSTI